MKHLDHPVLLYLVISLVSILCAVILFLFGGSLAQVTGNENSFLGFGFQAGGAIAGFILIFSLSRKAVLSFYGRKGNSVSNVKVYLQAKPSAFVKSNQYSAECTKYNEETGDRTNTFTLPSI